MKVYNYLRVSTNKQSFEEQNQACQQYAEANNLEIVALFKEVGSLNSKRLGLEVMLNNIVTHDEVGGVLVYDLTRLAREVDELAKYKKLLAEANKEIITVK